MGGTGGARKQVRSFGFPDAFDSTPWRYAGVEMSPAFVFLDVFTHSLGNFEIDVSIVADMK